jgi:pimeloyl-ACP methyl ester carboxylesterase
VLLLHGGGQTRRSWWRTAQALAAGGYQAVTLDARGHGDSDWSGEGYSIRIFSDDLREVVRQFEAPALIGASLGGLTALHLLGSNEPEAPRASALVLVDIATKTRQEGKDAIRDFMLSSPDGFATVEEAADAVSRYNPSRPRPSNVEGLRRNLRERNGRLHWHWDPGFMIPAGEGGNQQWAPEDMDAAARRVQVPTLLVRGANSDVVDQQSIDHIREQIPHVEVVEVPGAGHMVAGDANSPFGQATIAFLRRVYPA